MRNLTHYELRVLIKNEVQNMSIDAFKDSGITLYYQKARAEYILKYIAEYEALEPIEEKLEKSEHEEWREQDDARRYREWESDNRRPY